VGGLGTDTLYIVDTGAAVFNPVVNVTGIETVSIRNINGTAAVTAVAQVTSLTVAATPAGANGTLVVNYGGLTQSVVTGATLSTMTTAITAGINLLAGATVAVATTATGLVTVTAPVAGTALPDIRLSTFSVTADGAGYTNVATTANRAASGGFFTDTVAAGGFASATTFVNELSTNQVDFTALTAAQSVQINGNTTISNGATNAQSAATSTVAALTVNGGVNGGAVAVTSAGGVGVQTVTLTSTGSATGTNATAALGANVMASLALGTAATALNIVANNNATTGNITGFSGTASTITVTGTAGALNIGTLENTTVKTINASAFAGGVTTTLNTNTTIAVTGGLGNDTITTGAVLTTGSVNAGGGTGDILVVGTNVSHVNTASLAAKYTGFEILRLNGSMDASLISGLTQIQLTAATNTITNLGSGQTVKAQGTTIGNTTIAPVSGTANTLTLSLGTGSTTAAAAATSVLTLTGYSTVNMSTNAGPTATVGTDRTSTITGAIVDANLTNVNLTGTAFTFTDIATTLATTWDGTALTGNGDLTASAVTGLTVAGEATASSSFLGSAVSDSFTLGTAVASTYNGNAGNDFFIGTEAQLGTGASTNPVIIGGVGTDTLRITNTSATLTDANFKSVSTMEALNLNTTGVVSVTGLTTNANAAFSTGMTVTSGTIADTKAYTWESTAYAGDVKLTLVDASTGTTVNANITITTGAGADTVSVTAANFVSAATAAPGRIVIATGSGNDTITVATGTLLAVSGTASAVTITAGSGADTITVTTHANAGTVKGNFAFEVTAGDSTTTAYDNITGFRTALGGATISDALDFTGTSVVNVYNATAATGYTAAQLTVAVAATGIVTFAGTSLATLTLAEKIAAVQSVVTTVAGDTAMFEHSAAGVASTYIFNNNTADSVVQLVGVASATALVTTVGTTAGNIFLL